MGVYLTHLTLSAYTQIEKAVSECWASVLHLDEVDVGSDFFDLGGDSLSIVRIISCLFMQYQVSLTLGEFFDHPTVKDQARLIYSRYAASTTFGTLD